MQKCGALLRRYRALWQRRRALLLRYGALLKDDTALLTCQWTVQDVSDLKVDRHYCVYV